MNVYEVVGGMILFYIVLLLGWVVPPLFICYSMASKKGKSKGLWLLLAVIFGWIAVLILAIAAPEKRVQ